MADEVTLALLVQKVDGLVLQVRQYRDELRELLDDHEERLRSLEGKVASLGAQLTTWQMIQGAYTTAIGAIASFLGRQP